jgi:hypothetical protein
MYVEINQKYRIKVEVLGDARSGRKTGTAQA